MADEEGSAAADADAGVGKGEWPDAWRTQITQDAKELKQLERYSSPVEIWNKARALEQRMSSGELRSTLPKDAKPEELTKWRSENGIPETPDKYELKMSNNFQIPKEDRPVVDSFLSALHAENAPPAIASRAVDWYYGEVQRQMEERTKLDGEVKQKTEDTMRVKWGADYRTNLNRMDALVASMPEAVRGKFVSGRLGDGTPIMATPEMQEWLVHLSRELNPAATVVSAGGTSMAGSIDEELKAISDFRKKEPNAYYKDEAKQSRERDLIEARDSLKKREKQLA